MPDIAVVIVTWNVQDVVVDALNSLLIDVETNGLDVDVYVVDSASSDGTVDVIRKQFPQVKLLVSHENLGFGRANNWALREIGFGQNRSAEIPSAIYLLNPDTITRAGATGILFNALMSDETTGLVGPRLEYGDRRFQHSAFHFPGLKQLWVELFPIPGRLVDSTFNGRYSHVMYSGPKPFEIDFPLGAAMMLKHEVVEATGMFDEQFFMYCEEIDWAWRIQKAGWIAKCVPSAEVVHLGGMSTALVRPESVFHLWTSRLRLYRKHFPRWKVYLARFMIALGMRLKARQIKHDDVNSDTLRNTFYRIAQIASRS